jgi:hypothetical protein
MHGKPKRLRRKKTGASLDAPVLVNKNGDRMETYLQNFRWADDKYPVSTPLREMVDEIVQVSSWHRCSNARFYLSARRWWQQWGCDLFRVGNSFACTLLRLLSRSLKSRGTGRSGFVHPVVALPSVPIPADFVSVVISSTVFATVVSC